MYIYIYIYIYIKATSYQFRSYKRVLVCRINRTSPTIEIYSGPLAHVTSACSLCFYSSYSFLHVQKHTNH